MASNSHTRLQDSFSSEATASTPSTTSLTTPNIPRSLSRTPPPSPSPFMRSFDASEPPTDKHVHHMHTASPSSQFLNRPYTTLRRIWREHHHIRRILSFLCVLLPTLLTAAYVAGVYRGGARGVAMEDPSTLMPDAPILRHNPVGADTGQEQEQGKGQGWRGNVHGGLNRRAGIVPRQASPSSSSVDNADTPVLSLGGLGNTQSSSTSSASSTSLPPNSESLSATPTTTLLSTVAPSVPSSPVIPTPFVQPFDTTLSTDFLSASCQTYFANLTQSLDFRQCRPFSLLLPTSQEFLSAQTNLTLLTAIIYGTCTTTPSEDECVQRMYALGNDLRSECAQELGAGHALTWDALNGMKNYKMMRDAACLRNLRTNAYCFVDAAAASTPSDIYFYQLPLGTPLPGTSSADPASPTTSNSTSSSGSAKFVKRSIDWTTGAGGGAVSKDGITVTPTCSACTQSLMGIYASYATNSSLLISQTYGSAQKAVDATCGSGYASAVSAASATLVRPVFGLGGVVVALALVLAVAVGL